MARLNCAAATAILLCIMPLAARAAIISGGPTALLSQGSANQLESWLGGGSIQLNQIYNKQTGDTSSQFHAAVDNQGRTFSLIEVLAGTVTAYSLNQADITNVQGSGTTSYYDSHGQYHTATYYYGTTQIGNQIIGGYDPQSWNSSGSWNITNNDAARTGFLFNLTSTEIQRQNLNGQGYGGSGQYQTLNHSSYGPTFGGGFDIYVRSDLNSGYSYNWSYGGTSYFNSIITGGAWYDFNYQVGKIEVFTIADAARGEVPEPASLAIWGGIGLAGLVAGWRRKRSQTVKA